MCHTLPLIAFTHAFVPCYDKITAKDVCMSIRKAGIQTVISHVERLLDPAVQSIVSLMISLRHKFVKQISAKVTNTLLLF